MPGPSRLDDPQKHDSTTFVEKGGVTMEVLTSNLAEYKALGWVVVGPGAAEAATSSIDKAKVEKFNSTKRFFVVPNSEFPSE